MSDNVIILGAGFSYDAGIPLLGNFIDVMWELSMRRKTADGPLSAPDIESLKEALAVRAELDTYHGRATFDDRNIEDLLSMLAFNILGGDRSDQRKFDAFTKAIGNTIELTCKVKHDGFSKDGRYSINDSGPELYRDFWRSLFSWRARGNTLPTLISFNYDLVLERALYQVLVNKYYNQYDPNSRPPFEAVRVNYHYPFADSSICGVKYAQFGYSENARGTIIQRLNQAPSNMLEVDLLKLHGSLNFARNPKDVISLEPTLVDARPTPYILPPVANKSSNSHGAAIWRTALTKLRKAKNVIFVGYSLPKSDIYMQFFLRAALGPNQDLHRVFVFDPVLNDGDPRGQDMRERFSNCFSAQFRPRLDFMPTRPKGNIRAGTAEHFVNVLENNPNAILF